MDADSTNLRPPAGVRPRKGFTKGVERTEAKQGVEPGERDDPITYPILTKGVGMQEGIPAKVATGVEGRNGTGGWGEGTVLASGGA